MLRASLNNRAGDKAVTHHVYLTDFGNKHSMQSNSKLGLSLNASMFMPWAACWWNYVGKRKSDIGERCNEIRYIATGLEAANFGSERITKRRSLSVRTEMSLLVLP